MAPCAARRRAQSKRHRVGIVETDEECGGDGGTGGEVSGCSTPKAERFRIPEILTCPPAPKKRRVAAACCSSQRSPIAFYAPPDIELFFLYALRNISA